MIRFATAALARLRRYAASEDPLQRAANLMALVLAGNQPFYPLFVQATLGENFLPAWCVLPSAPLFFAVPAVSRRYPRLGRALLAVTGTANTLLCCRVFGEASGVGLLLFPCIGLAALLFRPGERGFALATAGLPMLAWFLLHDRFGPPLQLLSAAQYAHFATLNAISTGTLTAFLGLVFARAHGERSID
jgi:hypothetical protein